MSVTKYDIRGDRLTAKEIGAAFPVGSANTFKARVQKLGWDTERAALTPPDRKGRRGGRHRADAPRPCPALKRHNSGRAYVRWKAFGRAHERYFGPWGSVEAAAGYRRFASQWAAGAYELPQSDPAGLAVADLVIAWVTWAKKEYVKDGKPTSMCASVRCAARYLVHAAGGMYGAMRATEFAPAHHRAASAVAQSWCSCP